jgi:hypothetical protein
VHSRALCDLFQNDAQKACSFPSSSPPLACPAIAPILVLSILDRYVNPLFVPLDRTWSRVGRQPLVPVTGARKSAKIFGCVEVYDATFIYHSDEVFNGGTHVNFLEGKMAPCLYRPRRNVIYIHHNAFYHKEQKVQAWFHINRKWLEVHSATSAAMRHQRRRRSNPTPMGIASTARLTR